MEHLSFAELAHHPEHWFRQAEQLIAAADACLDGVPRPHPQRGNTEAANTRVVGQIEGGMLLLAFAVENALKGLAVHLGEHCNDDRGELKWKHREFGKHELTKMAKRLGVELNGRTDDLLERLTVYALWAGRYPLPKSETIYHEKRNRQQYRSDDSALVRELIAEWKREAGYDESAGWPYRRVGTV